MWRPVVWWLVVANKEAEGSRPRRSPSYCPHRRCRPVTRFIYSDDDIVASGPNLGLDFWWEAQGPGTSTAEKSGAQVLFPGVGLAAYRDRPAESNPWDQAFNYMAGLLDELATDSTAEPGPSSSTAKSEAGRVASGRAKSWGIARHYSPPVHMPALFNVRVLWEMEKRWSGIFASTRAHRRRETEEIELNFFYHHYLRLRGYPTARHTVKSFRVGYHLVQDCGAPKGAAECNRTLYSDRYNFICFNDGGHSEHYYAEGKRQLHLLLTSRFGSFAPHR